MTLALGNIHDFFTIGVRFLRPIPVNNGHYLAGCACFSAVGKELCRLICQLDLDEVRMRVTMYNWQINLRKVDFAITNVDQISLHVWQSLQSI